LVGAGAEIVVRVIPLSSIRARRNALGRRALGAAVGRPGSVGARSGAHLIGPRVRQMTGNRREQCGLAERKGKGGEAWHGLAAAKLLLDALASVLFLIFVPEPLVTVEEIDFAALDVGRL